ncbi:MAG: Holliday junction resolvase RecU [Bacilli bacterium]
MSMKIKYPDPTITIEKPNKNKSHGMLFENALNISNEYYRLQNRAIIYKKPTPIQVVKVDYPARSKARISEAFYRTPSTTDYNGIYQGKYIDYEAKETNNLSFAFKHIYLHQIEHLTKIDSMGGIGFIIIYFRKINEIYLIDIKTFNDLFLDGEKGGLKSIPVQIAKAKGVLVSQGYTPPIDYLKAVDQLYFK